MKEINNPERDNALLLKPDSLRQQEKHIQEAGDEIDNMSLAKGAETSESKKTKGVKEKPSSKKPDDDSEIDSLSSNGSLTDNYRGYHEKLNESMSTEDTATISSLKNKFDSFLNQNVKKESLDKVSSAQKMVDNYCNNHLHKILPEEKKSIRIQDTVEFQNDADFAKRLNGRADPARINGYNDGQKSYVKDSGPHPVKTAIHEHNHQLSCNDVKTEQSIEFKRGISINQKDVQVNEALTELFTKKMMGSEYPANPNVAYRNNMLRMEKMESAFGQGLLKEAYYQNKPELIRDKYESIMGKNTWESFSKAFDNSLSSDSATRNAAIHDADKYVALFVQKSKGVT